MNMLWTTYNSASSTAVCKVSGGSCALFVEGMRVFLGPLTSADAYLAAVPNTTLTSVVAVRNATTFNGIPNRAFLHLRSLSVSSSTSNTPLVIIRLIRNYTTGPATFAATSGTTADNGVTITNGQSCASESDPTSTTYTTVVGGKQIYSVVVAVNQTVVVDLDPLEISIFPGDTFSVCAFVTGNTPLVAATLTWTEDI
jgi:hypothetical protein